VSGTFCEELALRVLRTKGTGHLFPAHCLDGFVHRLLCTRTPTITTSRRVLSWAAGSVGLLAIDNAFGRRPHAKLSDLSQRLVSKTGSCVTCRTAWRIYYWVALQAIFLRRFAHHCKKSDNDRGGGQRDDGFGLYR